MQTADHIDTLCGSRIQHGPLNRRIYVMHLAEAAISRLLPALQRLAKANGYDKITARIPASCWPAFESAGYTREACVPGFFKGRRDGLFVARFLTDRRKRPCVKASTAAVYEKRPFGQRPAPTADGLPVSDCSPADAEKLAGLFGETFASYPFPINRPAYLKQAMLENVFYYCVHLENRIAAAAAAETDPVSRSCEMTDFATHPAYRRQGHARRLLNRMHRQARRLSMRTAYTIARADSRGMNRVFAQSGYRFAGRLINNTHIDGAIRDMNVWYRRL